ncbi:MAG: hypothetical protein K8F91_03690, partial [Candidatus Obscuribacterales bacterium]|nr:hypothetical protein [Candidatus Obscuribacterales bacterium]
MSKRKKVRTKDKSTANAGKLPALDVDAPRTYKMWLFGKLFRYTGSMIILTLNLAMIMSFLTRLPQGGLMDPLRELFFFAFLAVVDVMMLIPLLFEANKVETDSEKIRMQMLFFRRTLRWEAIVAF